MRDAGSKASLSRGFCLSGVPPGDLIKLGKLFN